MQSCNWNTISEVELIPTSHLNGNEEDPSSKTLSILGQKDESFSGLHKTTRLKTTDSSSLINHAMKGQGFAP